MQQQETFRVQMRFGPTPVGPIQKVPFPDRLCPIPPILSLILRYLGISSVKLLVHGFLMKCMPTMIPHTVVVLIRCH